MQTVDLNDSDDVFSWIVADAAEQAGSAIWGSTFLYVSAGALLLYFLIREPRPKVKEVIVIEKSK